MGQKVHPRLFRLGQTTKWGSRWFDIKNYRQYLLQDYTIRQVIVRRFPRSGIADIDIERFGSEIRVTIHTSRPGVIIGRGGAGIETAKKEIAKTVKDKLEIEIKEVKNPESNAAVIASNIAEQIERRLPFRRAVKQSIEAAKQARVQGIRISVAGRLNGADIARTEIFNFGKVPLHTIKQQVDYALRTAYTTYGTIGVKVWVLASKEAQDSEEI
ncbi:MAG: 30S ribosomal protein S3 [Patescibacteria group bacterium]|nr:30S ribosomal protein S3 [Patescibacteria group bacterium]